MSQGKNELTDKEKEHLINILKTRFNEHKERHKDLAWDDIENRIRANSKYLFSLNEMERTGGEPDVVALDKKTGEYIFADCSPESPVNRRSLCYDKEALDARKANKPQDSVVNMAKQMGTRLMDEAQYRLLQEIGPFDQKTSSWLQTPADIREKGGAIFGDYRYGRVFIYHNGADSYYSARGFRCQIQV